MKPRSDRPQAPHRRWGALPALLPLLALLAAGCTNSILTGGDGGLPPQDARELSLIVLQTRAQFPELSGTELPFEVLPEPAEDAARPELALRGQGTSVEPGLQSGTATRLDVALYLDKQDYALGWLEVTRGDKANERWPILAYEVQGDPRGTFQFLYVLAVPEGRVQYLVLIGGEYEKDGTRYHGFEGTLITPGPGRNLEQWQQGYKLNFGYRSPVVPVYQRLVERAVKQFREIRADVERLERLRRDIAATEGELASLRGAPPSSEDANRQQAAQRQERRLEDLNVQRDTLVGTAELRIVEYYGLRKSIAQEFATYLQSNPYRWLDIRGKQAAYDRWKVVEYHHPKIDEVVASYLTHQPEPAKVLDARKAAMEAIVRQDNWSKDPGRARKAREMEDAPSRKK